MTEQNREPEADRTMPAEGESSQEHHPAHEPEERQPDVDSYDVSPPGMPPSPAGANADVGGEAAASRRVAGLPPELRDKPSHKVGEPTEGEEPFLAYDSLDRDRIIAWIENQEPGPDRLRRIIVYEQGHRGRESIIDECRDRLDRAEG